MVVLCTAFIMAESFVVLRALGVFAVFRIGLSPSDEILTFLKRVSRLHVEGQDFCFKGRFNVRSRCRFPGLCRKLP